MGCVHVLRFETCFFLYLLLVFFASALFALGSARVATSLEKSDFGTWHLVFHWAAEHFEPCYDRSSHVLYLFDLNYSAGGYSNYSNSVSIPAHNSSFSSSRYSTCFEHRLHTCGTLSVHNQFPQNCEYENDISSSAEYVEGGGSSPYDIFVVSRYFPAYTLFSWGARLRFRRIRLRWESH